MPPTAKSFPAKSVQRDQEVENEVAQATCHDHQGRDGANGRGRDPRVARRQTHHRLALREDDRQTAEMIIIASVTTNGLIRNFATEKPLMKPMPAPTRSIKGSATSGLISQPGVGAMLPIRTAANVAVNARVDLDGQVEVASEQA